MFGQKNNDASNDTAADDQQTVTIAANNDSWQHPGQPINEAPSDDNSPTSAPAIGDSDISSGQPASSTSSFVNSASSSSSSSVISSSFPASGNDVASKDDSKDSSKDSAKDGLKNEDLLDTEHNDLVEIKQKALGELSPLMTHLDQSPEEKFKTLMMMIQASDDQKLIKEAYAAAQAIKDDKARAQALLDIVNEINYFTQQSNT